MSTQEVEVKCMLTHSQSGVLPSHVLLSRVIGRKKSSGKNIELCSNTKNIQWHPLLLIGNAKP